MFEQKKVPHRYHRWLSLTKRTPKTMMILVMILIFLNIITKINFVNPFTLKRRPALQRGLIAAPQLHAGSSNTNLNVNGDGDDRKKGKEDDSPDGNENENTLLLDWKLSSLLCCDPTMDAKFIPLIDVYDAATLAAEEEEENMEFPSKLPSTQSFAAPTNAPTTSGYQGPLPPSVAPYRMFVQEYNRDIEHDGRFSIFEAPSAVCDECDDETRVGRGSNPSLQSDLVWCTENPLQFVRDELSYRGKKQSTTTTNDSSKNRPKEDETVVFIPGLHTQYNNKCDDDADEYHRSSSERVKYYSQVLDGIPIALIHKGTHTDQRDLDIILTSDTINSLISLNLLTADCIESLSRSMDETSKAKKKRTYRLRSKDLDIIHTVLSRAGPSSCIPNDSSYTNGLKHTLIRLIDLAVESVRAKNNGSYHLVLMTYSASSNILMAALSEWKSRVTIPNEDKGSKWYHRDSSTGVGKNRDFSEEEAELLLHQALTVVTISALSQGFVDGPAYIHVSMNDDPLASSLGVSKLNPEGGGKDAVYLHAVSPYLIDDVDDDDESENQQNGSGEPPSSSTCLYKNDAHNIDACVIQYLSLVRRINGVNSFREMYNLGVADPDSLKLDINPSLFAVNSLYTVHSGNVGQLEIPPHVDCELIPAMIRATGGERYLFNSELQLGEGGVDGFFSPLPSLEYAQSELENQLGYNVYDEIIDNCCH